eukprot:TRINITY_DN1829_c0_g1_i4.p1 TRINITY_DN1829_c0_g1~~TRINITY_DN1829_c0_g1_i4.p1  ORF type:complete len:2863 (-),score=933.99 TRINITY_DN1829_c0_g1_i4:39-8627(-)
MEDSNSDSPTRDRRKSRIGESRQPTAWNDLEKILKQFLVAYRSNIGSTEANGIVQRFASTFNESYKEWNPEFDPDELQSAYHVMKAGLIPEVDESIIRAMVIELNRYMVRVSQVLVEEISDDKSSPMGHEYLYIINVLSRASNAKNIPVMMKFRVLTYPIQIAKLCSMKLLNLYIQKSPILAKWWMFLRVIIGHCLQIVCNFTSPSHLWKRDMSATDEMEQAKSLALSIGVMKFFRDLLTSIDTDVLTPSVKYPFQMLLLNTVGGILQGYPPAQADFKEFEVLDLLVSYLGWRNSDFSPQREFQIQLLAIQVIREAIYEHPMNASRVSQLGGFEKLMDCILWTSENFPTNTKHNWARASRAGNSDEIPMNSPRTIARSISSAFVEEDALPPPSPLERDTHKEISDLFNVLHSCIVRGISGSVATVTHKIILGLLLDIFDDEIRSSTNNTRSRALLQSKFPELQLQVLELLIRLLSNGDSKSNFEFSPISIIEICQNNQMWDILFSEYFFHFPAGDFSGTMKTQVLKFTEYVATIEKHDNTEELTKLVEMIELLGKDGSQSKTLLKVLKSTNKILKHNRGPTQHVLYSLQILSFLPSILLRPRSMDEDLTLYNEVRLSAIGLLNEMISNEEIANKVLAQKEVKEILFKLLGDSELQRTSLHSLVTLMKIDHTDPSDAYAIYNYYLNELGECQKKEMGLHLLSLMLGGIRRVLNLNLKKQRLFKKAGAFGKLLFCIVPRTDPEFQVEEMAKQPTMEQVLGEVLQTITKLLMNNPRNKENFARKIGYDQLVSVITLITGGDIPHSILLLLFDMLVDGDFNTESRYVIQNVYVADVLCELLLKFRIPEQETLLETLIEISLKSTSNQSILCAHSFIYKLAELIEKITQVHLLEKASHLIEILGSHSITVKELKKLYSLLKTKPGNLRPLCSQFILSAFQNMATAQRLGPESYFDFDGRATGIILPPISKFPTKAFTFSTWLRIESFQDPAGKPKYQPRIYSFLNKDGYGVEALFYGNQLAVESIFPNGKRYSVTFNEFLFEDQRWYHVAMSHSKHMLSQHEVRLFVDGVARQKGLLKYPNFDYVIDSGRIGTNVEIQAGTQRIYRENSFFGQMGAIYVFEDALTNSQVRDILLLGPNYTGVFQNEIITSSPKINSIQDGILAKSIFLCYNAKAVLDGKVCLDNTPEKTREAPLDAQMNLRNSIGITCSTRDVRDIIHCLGGIKICFPLFLQLELQVENGICIDGFDSQILRVNFCAQILDLIGDLLSTYNQQEMVWSKGFSIVAHLLKRSPGELTVDSIAVLSKINSNITVEDLKEEFITHLLLDFDLWSQTRYEVQRELLTLLGGVIVKTEYIRQTCGVQGLLDVIRLYYWEVSTPITLGDISKRRIDFNQMAALRLQILDLIYLFLRSGSHPITPNEVTAIMSFLVSTNEERHLVEVMTFVHSGLVRGTEDLLEHIEAGSGVELCLEILKDERETVRLATIKVIGELLHQASAHKTSKKATKMDNHIMNSIIWACGSYPYTMTMHNLLMNILTHGSREDQLDLKVPTFLIVIFKLSMSASVPIRAQAAQDILRIVVRDPNYFMSVLQNTHWIDWIVSFLSANPYPDPQFPKENEILRNSCVEIVSTCLTTCLFFEKGGWNLTKNVLVLLDLTVSRGVIMDATSIMRSIFTQTINNIRMEIRGQEEKLVDKHSLFLGNFTQFSHMVEDFIFYFAQAVAETASMPPGEAADRTQSMGPIQLHRNEDNLWADLGLARAFAELIDSLSLTNATSFNTKLEQSDFWRPGGFQRISIRISTILLEETVVFSSHVTSTSILNAVVASAPRLNKTLSGSIIVQDGDLQLVLESIGKLKLILNHEGDHLTAKTAFIFDKVLMSARRCRGNTLSKAIVPFLKEILRRYKNWLLNQFKEDKDLRFLVQWIPVITEMTIPDIVASFNNDSQSWEYIQIAVRDHAQAVVFDDKKANIVIEKNRRVDLPRVRDSMERDIDLEVQVEKRLASESHTLREALRQLEDSRIVNGPSLTDHTKLVTSNWRRMLRELKNERAAWGTLDEISETKWKLDKTENPSRMRMKLKPNRHFNDHRDALHKDTLQSQVPELPLVPPSKGFAIETPEADLWENPTEDIPPIEEEVSKTIYSVACEWISPMRETKGTLEITQSYLMFRNITEIPESEEEHHEKTDQKWPLEMIREMQFRRYLLQRSALEIFLTDRTNVFLNFTKKDRNKVYSKILSMRPPNLIVSENVSPEEILRKSNLTKRWQRRQITNFDYLMAINTISGRTYNDLTQYPVFPWVIADYTSEILDLKNPNTFRDLSKPIGALNPQRLKQLLERYEMFDDPVIPKFLYGSHYSSAATVLFYLIRMEPFTTYALELQGGKFDHADRLFHNVAQTWSNCLTSPADVKELIPEFFYLPEFLINMNNFNLGTRQNGTVIGNVTLPPWAKTPEDFVRLNREALESEFVSEHLHEWIDLIFGYKQRGRNAIEAHNVFYYLTYEGSVDLDAIDNEKQRTATKAQINNFGQTPTQLRKKPHPPRNTEAIFKSFFETTKTLRQYEPKELSSNPILYIGLQQNSETMVTVDAGRLQGSHKLFLGTPTVTTPFTFIEDPQTNFKRKLGIPVLSTLSATSYFGLSQDARVLVSCGHRDNTFKSIMTDTGKQIQSIVGHKDLVTCLAMGTSGTTLVTGSRDTTVMVWEISQNSRGNMFEIKEQPLHTLYGHDDEVTCVAVSVELDTIVSGSKDGSFIIHTGVTGRYVRSVYHPKKLGINSIGISILGHILVYCQEDLIMRIYNINCRLLNEIDLNERLNHFIISPDGHHFITGGVKGGIYIRKIPSGEVIQKFTCENSVCSLTLVNDKCLVAGLRTGKLIFFV